MASPGIGALRSDEIPVQCGRSAGPFLVKCDVFCVCNCAQAGSVAEIAACCSELCKDWCGREQKGLGSSSLASEFIF